MADKVYYIHHLHKYVSHWIIEKIIEIIRTWLNGRGEFPGIMQRRDNIITKNNFKLTLLFGGFVQFFCFCFFI